MHNLPIGQCSKLKCFGEELSATLEELRGSPFADVLACT